MQSSIQASKKALRERVLARLAQLTPADRNTASARACALLEQQKIWKEAQSALFFAPLPEELDIWPLFLSALKSGKMVALPRFIRQTKSYIAHRIRDPAAEVVSGYYGIREPLESCPPISSNRLDLILVPGVAFDLHGRRLGRGRAFYDQLLTAVRGTTCGVGFDEQIEPEIPVEPHDVLLNCILTPTRWLVL